METAQTLAPYRALLSACPLFSGLGEEALSRALAFFDARKMLFSRGEFLHRAGEPLSCFGLVLEGGVQVASDDLDGNRMIMATVSPGETFGESLCFLGVREAPVSITAEEDSAVLRLSPASLSRAGADPQEAEFTRRFTAMLAARTLQMNSRIQILSKLTLREKLLTFFSDQAKKTGADTFSVPLDRKDMATYLGADRSALSRELARMKREGLIDYYRNSCRINR